MENSENKPCLVKAGQGFSVEYKGKFLYSKYAPEKNSERIAESFQIPDESLVLCFSPLLCYGLKTLTEKTTSKSRIICIEKDENLFEITKKEDFPEIYFLSDKEARAFISELNQTFKGEYKRVLKIELSAGSSLNRDFYDSIFIAASNIVNQFWKNRITLVKFGRKYSENIFKNLPLVEKGKSFFKVSKPILVVGAGESALEVLENILRNGTQKKFYIIAVDAVLRTISSMGLKADAAVCEESQNTITKAFVGGRNCYDNLFLSLSANDTVARLNPEKNVFYTSVFDNSTFLKKIIDKKIAPTPFPPLGSVGLSALQVALTLRKDTTIPVFVCGLDFSYSKGESHVKGSFPYIERLKRLSRISGIESFGGSFSKEVEKRLGKEGKTVYTTKALSLYRDLFQDKFEGIANLFDAGKTGLPLGIPCLKTEEMSEIANCFSKNSDSFEESETNNSSKNLSQSEPQDSTYLAKKLPLQKDVIPEVKSTTLHTNQASLIFLKDEKKALEELKSILKGEKNLPEEAAKKRILEILEEREYLYLHFPDGKCATTELSFLKRVRNQIDFFLKIMDRAED